jgi:ABC-type branched-subunit amino acid transport system ATPase component
MIVAFLVWAFLFYRKLGKKSAAAGGNSKWRKFRQCEEQNAASIFPPRHKRWPKPVAIQVAFHVALPFGMDEPASALDVSIQRQVLQLLGGLQRKYGLSYVLISHGLAVIAAMSHQIVVMHNGAIVEAGPAPVVLETPRHDYTRHFIQASL